MRPLRIGFLLPRYSQPSNSQMPVAMRMLAERGVVVDVIYPADRAIEVSALRVAHDLYVLKNTSGLAMSVAGALHAQGAAIVNPFPATVALQDRATTARVLAAAGVPVPATYLVRRPGELAPLLEQGPLVVKPYQESGNVRVIGSAAELAALAESKQPVFAQRYHAPEGRDRKLYAIGERLFGVKKISPPKTEAEKHGEPFVPNAALREIALRCGSAFGIDLYGVDVIEREGRPWVVDMCSIPGFKGVPDAPAQLAAYFHRAAERAARGEPPAREPAPIAALEGMERT
jgi:ribosomal protein S6--L-glutamate ligase